MKKSSKLCVFFIFIAAIGYGQNSEFRIGKSTADKLQRNKAAQIVATFPQNDTIPNSWLIDGFVEYSRKDEALQGFEIGFFAEIHKNTLISNRQDVQQFGLSLKRVFDFLPESSAQLFMHNTLTIRDSKDFVKDKQELQIITGTTFKLRNRPKDWMRFLQAETALINEKPDEKSTSDYFNLTHNHNFGLGYIGGDEEILLGNASFEVNLYPLSSLFYKKKFKELKQTPEFLSIKDESTRLKTLNKYKKQAGRFRNMFYISWTINARKELTGNTDRNIQTLNKITGGINYNISEKSAIGLAYLWQKGANPYVSLDNQTFSTLTAQFKILL